MTEEKERQLEIRGKADRSGEGDGMGAPVERSLSVNRDFNSPRPPGAMEGRGCWLPRAPAAPALVTCARLPSLAVSSPGVRGRCETSLWWIC